MPCKRLLASTLLCFSSSQRIQRMRTVSSQRLLDPERHGPPSDQALIEYHCRSLRLKYPGTCPHRASNQRSFVCSPLEETVGLPHPSRGLNLPSQDLFRLVPCRPLHEYLGDIAGALQTPTTKTGAPHLTTTSSQRPLRCAHHHSARNVLRVIPIVLKCLLFYRVLSVHTSPSLPHHSSAHIKHLSG